MCSDTSVWLVQVDVHWVRQLTNCTFSCTHRSLGSLPNYMHTSGACKRALTRESDVCLYMCIESYAWLTQHFMHISVTRLTPHLHEHIGQSDQCTFICTHQVHVNVQWPVCLTCACKCPGSQTIGSLHIFMHTSATAQLHEHIRQSVHCTFTCKHQVHVNVQRPECVTCACKWAES